MDTLNKTTIMATKVNQNKNQVENLNHKIKEESRLNLNR